MQWTMVGVCVSSVLSETLGTVQSASCVGGLYITVGENFDVNSNRGHYLINGRVGIFHKRHTSITHFIR